jgi:hypothetical protein
MMPMATQIADDYTDPADEDRIVLDETMSAGDIAFVLSRLRFASNKTYRVIQIDREVCRAITMALGSK